MTRRSAIRALGRKWTLAAMALSAAAAIALGHVHPFGDPRSMVGSLPQRDLRDLLSNAEIPTQARTVLIAKCADCHSNATRWPVYARIAPASWLIERDVVEGRKRMNLSTWGKLTPDRRQVLESKIVHATRMGDMPPLQYRAIHWGASLSREDVQALAMLANHPSNENLPLGIPGKQNGAAETGGDAAGDPVRGKAIFEQRCTGCHALDANREGPHLRGVFGRKAGSVADFTYSSALKKSTITWNETLLNEWLTDPDTMMPGNNMGFRVVKATERSDLVAFLKQVK